ncbi:MAG: alpha/beta fold hydrolase [Polyangiales bacterium]
MVRSLFRGTARQLASGIDRAFARSSLAPRGPADIGPEDRMQALGLIERFYGRPEHFSVDSAFFTRPEPIEPKLHRVRGIGKGGEVLDLRWPSGFEPLWSDVALTALVGESLSSTPLGARVDRSGSLRDKYLGARGNRTAAARWFRHHGEPRPCIVLLHGFMGGAFALEERVFPVRKLFAGGLDVLLFVLPFHGVRRDERRGLRPPLFPSGDPRFTIEGMRQLVHDHRALLDYLERGGAPSFGVMGMSLGGYACALLATLEPRLRFAVLFIPLAAIDEFAHQHGRMLGSAEEQRAQADALGRAQRVVSPLARPSLLPAAGVIVIEGEHDMVTGPAHSRPLAEHFGVTPVSFGGGHLLQLGRGGAFAPVFEMLERAGLYGPPHRAG